MTLRTAIILTIAFLSLVFCVVLKELTEQINSSQESMQNTKNELLETKRQLGQAIASIQKADEKIKDLESKNRSFETSLEQNLKARLDKINQEVNQYSSFERDFRDQINSIKKVVLTSEDIESLYKDILYPSLQVEAANCIGGGTVIYSKKGTTYVLSAYHVVKKGIREEDDTVVYDPVDVKIYAEDARYEKTVKADLVCFDENKDIALLKLRSDEQFKNIAILCPQEKLKRIKVFTQVYTVGCPLGNAPFPTLGHITNLNKQIDSERYWMMSAPTIFGNSGGGVFLKETHELIGISNMIATIDNVISTPVYHMSIFVPLDQVYMWLDANNLSFIYETP